MSNSSKRKKGGSIASTFCRVLGIVFIVIVIITCLPLTIPTLFGYGIYNVETGSMSPEIPVGSVIYVEQVAPEDVKEGDVITFSLEEASITHRVVENNFVQGEFVTKGDANEKEDMKAVPYSALTGRVAFHFPFLGKLLIVYGTTLGKVYVLIFAACGVLLNILGSMLRKR